MAVTKDEERKALARINKIVEALGEDSYVATAFEGCFEDAEENIENDFACSWKQRAESAQEKLEKAQYRLDTVIAERDYYEKQVDELSEKYAELQKNILSVADLDDCMCCVKTCASEIEDKVAAAASDIVAFAEDPKSGAFLKAVRAHRMQSQSLEYHRALIDRIDNALKAGRENEDA